MKLKIRKIGEAVAAVGVVLGLVALWMNQVVGTSSKYSNDGTITASIIIVLGIAACCLGASLLGYGDLDLAAATTGALAFGFYLFVPAISAFKSFDWVGAGAWVGICAGLVPLGAGVAHFSAREQSDENATAANPATAVAAIGLVLIVTGTWMNVLSKTSTSYWNASASGHVLGLLLLLLALASALLLAGAFDSRSGCLADLALIVSGITAGLAMQQGVKQAFGAFDAMGSGAWVELIGGLVLLIGLIGTRVLIFPSMEQPASAKKTAK